MIKKLLCSSLFLVFMLGYAQDTETVIPIATDRPGAGTSPGLVGKGYLQLETAAQYEGYDSGNLRSKVWILNTSLLRFGLLDNLELRLGWDFQEIKTEINGMESSDIQSGYTPLLVGLKVGVTEEYGLLPQIGIIGHIFLPFSAGKDFKPHNTGAEILLAFSNTLDENSSLDYVLGANWGNDSAELNFAYSFSYGRSFTTKFGGFAEVYGVLPENSKGQNFWDIGFTYLLNNDLQLDASFGTGFDNDQSILLGAGISYRLR